MADWKEYKLGDFADIQTGPFGSQLHAADYVLNGIPSIMPTNIGSRLNIVTDDIVCITEKDAERLKRYTVRSGDIVYSRRGDVEKCAFITSEQNGWLCGTGSLRIRFISKEIEPKFCAYYLSTPAIKSWVLNNSVGSTMPNLNSTILSNLPLQLPPLPEQQAIAEVLSSLDDKIDLLHRQNKTLEALAETLFRQWFIEEAKESWETKPLEQLCTITRGASPRPIIEYVKNGTVPWIKIADATGSNTFFIDNTKEFIIESGVDKSVKVSYGDLILSNSATCGLPYFVEIEGCIHDGWLLFRDFKEISKFYAFFFLKQINRELNNFADGSVQNNLNTGILKEYPVNVPPENLVKKFDEEAGIFVDKIKRNIYQIRSLTTLRDTLLPKLMSGEVRVNINEAETAIANQ
jgi:type I restriction enzyme S subunit